MIYTRYYPDCRIPTTKPNHLGVFHIYHLYPISCLAFCLFLTTSMFLSFQLDFRILIGRLPTYLPFISLMALVKSPGSLKLMKPKPLVLLVFLSRITLAFWKEGYRPNVRAKTSSVTSLPRSPQNTRKSFWSQSFRVSSSQICPPPED